MAAQRVRAIFFLSGLALADGLRAPAPARGRTPGQLPAAIDSRRTVLAATILTAFAVPVGAATFAERTDASLELIRNAESGTELVKGLTQLGDLADEYGGLADRQEDVVQKVRTVKTSALWSAEVDAAYRDAMRSIDPFRIVAVKPAVQTAVYAYAPIYVGLIGVQQVLPKFFPPAYAAAALVIFGPIAFALLNS